MAIFKRAQLLFILLISMFGMVQMRRHSLVLENDSRRNFALSTFGFLKGGGLMVDIQNFSFQDPATESTTTIGFSLEKTGSDGVSSYMEQHTDKCILRERDGLTKQVEMLLFTLDFKKKKILATRVGNAFNKLEVNDVKLPDKAWYLDSLTSYIHRILEKLNLAVIVPLGDKEVKNHTVEGRAVKEIESKESSNVDKKKFDLPLNKTGKEYSGIITVVIDSDNEGLYNLYFHNCQTTTLANINMELRIIEHNIKTFLSAGEIPLPTIYGVISLLFFLVGCFYITYLRRHKEWTFKIHYLMAAVVLLKSFSLVFHAMNYYYIGKDGRRMESWAVLFYITHLLKGALMFTCIVLIGTGFFFVKQVLSTKEKRVFMIVIPLQILANVASIMIDSTEEGKAQYKTWIFILVDLICCGTVLFPVVWSIRHLQEAAKTDGKAISLAKLKLFRHFYIMIVCFIYFTRIIVYLIKIASDYRTIQPQKNDFDHITGPKYLMDCIRTSQFYILITVPFRYIWLDAFFTEVASLVFFVVTGYKFRPAETNPYLHVPEDDIMDDIEMDEIQTQSGLTEGLSRVNTIGKRTTDPFAT